MPLSTEGFKEKVKDIVRVHYEKSSAPLMLAHLGAVIEREDAWPEDRGERSLKRLLKDLLYPELDVVWDEGSPAFIAVVTPALRSTVQAQIERRHIERRHHDVAT